MRDVRGVGKVNTLYVPTSSVLSIKLLKCSQLLCFCYHFTYSKDERSYLYHRHEPFSSLESRHPSKHLSQSNHSFHLNFRTCLFQFFLTEFCPFNFFSNNLISGKLIYGGVWFVIQYNFRSLNPFSAMGDFRHHIMVNFAYLGVK